MSLAFTASLGSEPKRRRGPRRKFSAGEDALILEAASGELATLAERLGISRTSIYSRRQLLLRDKCGTVERFLEVQEFRQKLANPSTSVFARPSWFEEKSPLDMATSRRL